MCVVKTGHKRIKKHLMSAFVTVGTKNVLFNFHKLCDDSASITQSIDK